MNDETIVVVYDSAEVAAAAVSDLVAAGIPREAISSHTGTAATTTQTTGVAPREPGFWASLFGGESDYDTAVYDRSLSSGSTVVTVRVAEDHLETATSILEKHRPVDIEERATSYGLSTTGTATTSTAYGVAGGAAAPVAPPVTGTLGRENEEVLRLAEEELSVGKRLVNRGTTRIRRFVVETPVEESVNLHSERVLVERRPISGGAAITDANFTDNDRVIEVTESTEEAVVAKNARLKEEIVVRKESSDRVETVRDTVRREDVEITKDGAPVTSGTPINPGR